MSEEETVKYNYAYFPIIINEDICGVDRNELYDKLKEYNICTRRYFYPLVTDFQCYRGIYDDSNLNNAKYIVDRVLTLRSLSLEGKMIMFHTLAIILLVASLDEIFKIFIDGRTSSIKDVLIDFIGGIIGYTECLAIKNIKSKIIKRIK